MKPRETTIAAALLSTLIIAGSAANAQQGGKIPRIGLIWASTPLATWQASPVSQGFLKGLHDLGYEEGRNIIIEFRSAEGHWERLPKIANELLGEPPRVCRRPFGLSHAAMAGFSSMA